MSFLRTLFKWVQSPTPTESNQPDQKPSSFLNEDPSNVSEDTDYQLLPSEHSITIAKEPEEKKIQPFQFPESHFIFPERKHSINSSGVEHKSRSTEIEEENKKLTTCIRLLKKSLFKQNKWAKLSVCVPTMASFGGMGWVIGWGLQQFRNHCQDTLTTFITPYTTTLSNFTDPVTGNFTISTCNASFPLPSAFDCFNNPDSLTQTGQACLLSGATLCSDLIDNIQSSSFIKHFSLYYILTLLGSILMTGGGMLLAIYKIAEAGELSREENAMIQRYAAELGIHIPQNATLQHQLALFQRKLAEDYQNFLCCNAFIVGSISEQSPVNMIFKSELAEKKLCSLVFDFAGIRPRAAASAKQQIDDFKYESQRQRSLSRP